MESDGDGPHARPDARAGVAGAVGLPGPRWRRCGRGSPYEQWGRRAAGRGRLVRAVGPLLASAARRRAPSPGPRPRRRPAPRRAGPVATPGTSGPTPQNLRIASVRGAGRRRGRRRRRRSRPSARRRPRGGGPSPGAVGGEDDDRRARGQVPRCFARPDRQPEKKVCQVVLRDAAAEREARRLAHRARAARRGRSRATADRAGAGAASSATMLKASDEGGRSRRPTRRNSGCSGAASRRRAPPSRRSKTGRRGLGAAPGPPGRPSSRPCSSRGRRAQPRAGADPGRHQAAEFMERQRGYVEEARRTATRARRSAPRALDEARTQASRNAASSGCPRAPCAASSARAGAVARRRVLLLRLEANTTAPSKKPTRRLASAEREQAAPQAERLPRCAPRRGAPTAPAEASEAVEAVRCADARGLPLAAPRAEAATSCADASVARGRADGRSSSAFADHPASPPRARDARAVELLAVAAPAPRRRATPATRSPAAALRERPRRTRRRAFRGAAPAAGVRRRRQASSACGRRPRTVRPTPSARARAARRPSPRHAPTPSRARSVLAGSRFPAESRAGTRALRRTQPATRWVPSSRPWSPAAPTVSSRLLIGATVRQRERSSGRRRAQHVRSAVARRACPPINAGAPTPCRRPRRARAAHSARGARAVLIPHWPRATPRLARVALSPAAAEHHAARRRCPDAAHALAPRRAAGRAQRRCAPRARSTSWRATKPIASPRAAACASDARVGPVPQASARAREASPHPSPRRCARAGGRWPDRSSPSTRGARLRPRRAPLRRLAPPSRAPPPRSRCSPPPRHPMRRVQRRRSPPSPPARAARARAR